MNRYWEWRDKEGYAIHLWFEDGQMVIMSNYETREEAIDDLGEWQIRATTGAHSLMNGFPEGPYTLAEVFE